MARALSAAAALVVLAGCASIPTSGPVREGKDLRLARAEDGVPFIGQPPAGGADPENVVSGFLQNGADFQNDHEIAREYLTPTARQRWRPQAGTIVYERLANGLPIQVSSGGRVTVEVAASGRIDADGSYHRSPGGPPVTLRFRLEQVDGEWRIAELPDGLGLVLSSADVRETYRQVSLYFLAPSGVTLVPDLVLIPELPGLSTKLVSRLLRGPTRSLQEAVTTAFPRGTGLEVSSVPVQDGIATVSLDSSALDADDQAREQMSAQLVWTLKQLPGVLRIRIRAGGESLAVSGAEEQPRDAWPTYDPDRLTADPSAYVARDGRIGRYLVGNNFQPVPGPGGAFEPPSVQTPAVSLDATRLAAVSTDGKTVYVGELAAGAGFSARIRGTDLSAPSWDPERNLWVVDRATGTVRYLPNGADSAQEVEVPQLADGSRPSAVAVSRDGAEVALLMGTGRSARLMLGGISRVEPPEGGERVSVVALREPAPDLRGVRDMGWADATSLVVLGSLAEAAVAPYYIDTNGYRVDPITPLPDPVSITAAPPRDPQKYLVAGTRDGQLLDFTSARGWSPLGAGTDPAYPG